MKTFLKIFIVSFFILIIGIYSGGLFYTEKNHIDFNGDIGFGFYEEKVLNSLVTKVESNKLEEYTSLEEAFSLSNRINIMILGMEDLRTDTIIFASLCPDSKSINLISIPRDTYIHRKGKDSGQLRKINSVYQDNGLKGLETTISHILEDVPIHHYIELDYEGVINIVDSIGGVEVDVPFHMKYLDTSSKPVLDINIPQGLQNLDGKQVLDFLRYRKGNNKLGYIDGDIGRIKSQQSFLKSFAKKVLKNPFTIISNGIQYINTDISFFQGINYGRKVIGINSEDVLFETLPGMSELRDVNKKIYSYFIHDEKKVKSRLEEIYNVTKK